jgi:hypothetical protein
VEDRPQTSALVRPVVQPAALIEVHKEVTALITQCLEKGRDYGVIPGTGDKPTLLKPGAERLAIAFGAFPRYENVMEDVDHDRAVTWTKRKKIWRNQFKGDREFTWQQESGTSLGLYRYVVRCTLVRREDGATIAEGIGSCSTMESKYIDRPRDNENTVLKMAQKRALIAATLNGFGLSDRFTQDVEDTGNPYENGQAQEQETQSERDAREHKELLAIDVTAAHAYPFQKKTIGDLTDKQLTKLAEQTSKAFDDGDDRIETRKLARAVRLVQEKRAKPTTTEQVIADAEAEGDDLPFAPSAGMAGSTRIAD